MNKTTPKVLRWWARLRANTDRIAIMANPTCPTERTRCKAIIWLTPREARIMGLTKSSLKNGKIVEIEPLRIIRKESNVW